jgi:hypothetical protein
MGREAFREGRKDSSFCEQKEAKKLHPLMASLLGQRGCKRMKVFWFFFSKKNTLAYLAGTRASLWAAIQS